MLQRSRRRSVASPLVVVLNVVVVSFSLSDAFLPVHFRSFDSGASRFFRNVISAFDDDPASLPRDSFVVAESVSSRRQRSAADAESTSPSLVGMGPGPENPDANFEDGVLTVINGEEMKVKLYGAGFDWANGLKFDSRAQEAGTTCEHQIEGVELRFQNVDPAGRWAVVTLTLDEPKYTPVFVCLRRDNTTKFVHQGHDESVVIQTKTRTSLPFGLQVTFLIVLLMMSGMFSGLNLGLMALDKTELQIVMNCGVEKEKKYARRIQPVRNKGNYLLCTLLLSNVLVNSTLTILMDELTGGGGLVAIIGSTLGIVVFGEIIPQAVCSRHGLAVGAYTLWITKFFMLVTFPIAFPISLILDKMLGEEIGSVYDRNRLRELIQVTHGYHDLKTNEVKIIAGALALSEKKVREIMTPLEDVFMIGYDAVLDFHTMSDIMKRGYTRIPVYDGERTNIVGLLNIKDLAFVDPDDCIPLKTLCKFYQHHLHSVFEDTKLDLMLEEFKKGQCHMALVQYVNNEGEGDPFYEIIGVVTLEDVIEEIIQSEILDETDMFIDNKHKNLREHPHNPDFTVFYSQEDQAPRITPQLSLAVFQFLSVNVEPFQERHLSSNILRRLIKKYDVIEDLRHKDTKPTFIFERNKPADFFCLILQGRVEVHVGKEDMVFETGPFSFFGVQALTSLNSSHSFLSSSRSSLNNPVSPSAADGGLGGVPSAPPVDREASAMSGAGGSGTFQRAGSGKPPVYVPDFSVRTTTDTQILKIRRSHYLAARRAVLLERQPRVARSSGATTPGDGGVDDAFNKEWTKTLNHLNRGSDLRTGSFRDDWLARDRRSTASSTAKEPETSSETLPSPQMYSQRLSDFFSGGADNAIAAGAVGTKRSGGEKRREIGNSIPPASDGDASTLSRSFGGGGGMIAANRPDFRLSPESLPPSISALASPLSPYDEGRLPSPDSSATAPPVPSPPPPSYASLAPTEPPPPRSEAAALHSGPAAPCSEAAAAPGGDFSNAPEVDLADVAVVDVRSEKKAFLARDS